MDHSEGDDGDKLHQRKYFINLENEEDMQVLAFFHQLFSKKK